MARKPINQARCSDKPRELQHKETPELANVVTSKEQLNPMYAQSMILDQQQLYTGPGSAHGIDLAPFKNIQNLL